MIRRFVSSAVGKICRIWSDNLREQEALGWLIALTFVIFVISWFLKFHVITFSLF